MRSCFEGDSGSDTFLRFEGEWGVIGVNPIIKSSEVVKLPKEENMLLVESEPNERGTFRTFPGEVEIGVEVVNVPVNEFAFGNSGEVKDLDDEGR